MCAREVAVLGCCFCVASKILCSLCGIQGIRVVLAYGIFDSCVSLKFCIIANAIKIAIVCVSSRSCMGIIVDIQSLLFHSLSIVSKLLGYVNTVLEVVTDWRRGS